MDGRLLEIHYFTCSKGQQISKDIFYETPLPKERPKFLLQWVKPKTHSITLIREYLLLGKYNEVP